MSLILDLKAALIALALGVQDQPLDRSDYHQLLEKTRHCRNMVLDQNCSRITNIEVRE